MNRNSWGAGVEHWWERFVFQFGPGSILARCHMRVEFVVGRRLTPRVFRRVVRFSSLRKNKHFQIPIRPGQDRGTRMKPSHGWCGFSKCPNLFIYFYLESLFITIFTINIRNTVSDAKKTLDLNIEGQSMTIPRNWARYIKVKLITFCATRV